MDIEILDTLPVIAKLRPDLCELEGSVYKLKFPDGSRPLEIDVGDEDREGGDSDFAIVTGWTLQVLLEGLSPVSSATLDVGHDYDGVYSISAMLFGMGSVGESDIFNYALLECLRRSVERLAKA